MKININEEEVRHILKMHSKEREKTFLLKEDNASDIEKLRIAMASGCVNKGGNLYTRKDNGRAIYRVKSLSEPTKQIDFYADLTYVFVDGSKSGRWRCAAIATTLDKKESDKAAAEAAAETAKIAQVATDANITNLKTEGGWKTYEELISTDTKENIENPVMYEKKISDGRILYRRTSGSGITDGLDERQKVVIDKFKAVGAKLEKEVDALQAKTWTRKLVSPKGDGLFVQDLYMYFPPTAITDTQITNAFNQSLKDQTPENDDDCKMSIEAYYTAFKKKKKLTDDEFSSMKDKVQACKNEFYGDWQGLFGGGGKKYDEYLDVLSGVRNGKDGTQSPRTYGDTSKWKLN
jgi:hypothetical protein